MRTRIEIKPGFFLVLAAAILMEGLDFAGLVLLAASLHELGHCAAIRLCGGRIQALRMGHTGAEILFDGRLGYLQDMLIALAGPAASLLAALAVDAAYGQSGSEAATLFAGLNLLYCLCNLLPLSVLDGGRFLFALCSAVLGPFHAGRIASVIDAAGSALLFAAGVYAFAKTGGNLTLLLCSVFLLDACCKSSKNSVNFHH